MNSGSRIRCNCFYCILKTLENEFQEELAAVTANENHTVDWTFVRKALKRLTKDRQYAVRKHNRVAETHSQNRNSTGTFWEIFQCIMGYFDTLNLQDTSLAVYLLYYAYYFMEKYEKISEFHFPYMSALSVSQTIYEMEEHDKGPRDKLTKLQFQKLLTVVYEAQRSIEENLVTDASYDSVQYQIVWETIRRRNDKLLSGLLKYGVMFVPSPYLRHLSPEHIHFEEAVAYLLYSRRNLPPPKKLVFDLTTSTIVDIPNQRLITVLRIIELLAYELRARDESDGTPGSRSSYFKYLRLAYDTVPEPIVTSKEVKEIFQLTCSENDDNESDDCIDELISELERLYPESAEPLAPRSLQHLSRCQVRDNLRLSGTLPHGVKQLELSKFEDYILLDQ